MFRSTTVRFRPGNHTQGFPAKPPVKKNPPVVPDYITCSRLKTHSKPHMCLQGPDTFQQRSPLTIDKQHCKWSVIKSAMPVTTGCMLILMKWCLSYSILKPHEIGMQRSETALRWPADSVWCGMGCGVSNLTSLRYVSHSNCLAHFCFRCGVALPHQHRHTPLSHPLWHKRPAKTICYIDVHQHLINCFACWCHYKVLLCYYEERSTLHMYVSRLLLLILMLQRAEGSLHCCCRCGAARPRQRPALSVPWLCPTILMLEKLPHAWMGMLWLLASQSSDGFQLQSSVTFELSIAAAVLGRALLLPWVESVDSLRKINTEFGALHVWTYTVGDGQEGLYCWLRKMLRVHTASSLCM